MPILDYGSSLYGSAKDNKLKKLNVVHHTALRMVSGAFRTSPIVSLLAECGQPSLQVRRNILLSNYVYKVASNPDHPVYTLFFNLALRINIRNENLPKTLIARFRLLEQDIPLNPRYTYKKSATEEPWCFILPKVRLLTSTPKSSLIHPEVTQLHHAFRDEHIENYMLCYTDGSKTENNTGGAYLFNGEICQFKLNTICSVFTAELVAILKCLDSIINFIQESLITKNFIICSDSKSALLAIQNCFSDSILVCEILSKILKIYILGHTVRFLWLPSHFGIRENDIVDNAAKNSHLSRLDPYYTHEDMRNTMKNKQRKVWLQEWEMQPETNKLRKIKKDTKLWKSSHRETRVEEMIICRLRIGHTKATHKHLLERKDPPVCDLCGTSPLTVKHWLTECTRLRELRRKHHLGTNMKEILDDDVDSIDRCLNFLREAEIFDTI
ncbi:hypothetical protein M8J77_003539 [Diaphorina citri]|nr:hypothetical protein M8J77_026056 [Diaphorina citri]KAI5738146.1 hypothetical protein M8J77_003539 [Diaphorina citri]